MGGGNTDFGPKLGPHEHEVIQFSKPVRKRNMHGSVSSIDRDPFKVRDGLQSRKASSGVYTRESSIAETDAQRFFCSYQAAAAHTFPGPSQRPNLAFPATSPTTSTFSHDSSHHQHHSSHHKQAHRARSLGSFQRFSMHLNKESEPPVPPLPISNPRSSYHPHTQYVPKPSYSPTSARSGGSITPPDTPTTPTSVNIAGHRVPASSVARPVVIMSNDFGPGVDFSRSPVECGGLGLGLEDAKLPPTPLTPSSYILRSSNQPPQLPPIDASPSAMPSPPAVVKTSPTPKRTRRKPVPRLDEDMIEHLEALETGSDPRTHAL